MSVLSVVKQSISGGVGYILEQYKDLNMFPASHIYEHLVYLHLVYGLVPDLIKFIKYNGSANVSVYLDVRHTTEIMFL